MEDLAAARAHVAHEAQLRIAGGPGPQPRSENVDAPLGDEGDEFAAVLNRDELGKFHTHRRRQRRKLTPLVADLVPTLAGALVFERGDCSASDVVGVS